MPAPSTAPPTCSPGLPHAMFSSPPPSSLRRRLYAVPQHGKGVRHASLQPAQRPAAGPSTAGPPPAPAAASSWDFWVGAVPCDVAFLAALQAQAADVRSGFVMMISMRSVHAAW